MLKRIIVDDLDPLKVLDSKQYTGNMQHQIGGVFINESNRVEFKRELNDSLEKEVVGFLNYAEGGEIYIGSVTIKGSLWVKLLILLN